MVVDLVLASFRLLGLLTSASAHPAELLRFSDLGTIPPIPSGQTYFTRRNYGSFISIYYIYTRTSDLPPAIRDFQGLVKAGLLSPTLEANAADTPDVVTGVRQAGV